MDSKKLYEEEILNVKIETNEDEKLVNKRYEKLNGIMESMYDFILAYLTITERGKELALIHKKYDNLDIVKTKKKLLKKFTIEELIAFDKICKEYTEILRYKKEKK